MIALPNSINDQPEKRKSPFDVALDAVRKAKENPSEKVVFDCPTDEEVNAAYAIYVTANLISNINEGHFSTEEQLLDALECAYEDENTPLNTLTVGERDLSMIEKTIASIRNLIIENLQIVTKTAKQCDGKNIIFYYNDDIETEMFAKTFQHLSNLYTPEETIDLFTMEEESGETQKAFIVPLNTAEQILAAELDVKQNSLAAKILADRGSSSPPGYSGGH